VPTPAPVLAFGAPRTTHHPPLTASSPLEHLFVVGYPGDVGGANTECWHTVKLWRQFGLEVTFLPTWKPDAKWQARLEGIGCRTVRSNPNSLGSVPGLRGSAVVSFCNSRFLRHADRFRNLGCRVIWVGCMTWLFAINTSSKAGIKRPNCSRNWRSSA
jgi:hypothetical protein